MPEKWAKLLKGGKDRPKKGAKTDPKWGSRQARKECQNISIKGAKTCPKRSQR